MTAGGVKGAETSKKRPRKEDIASKFLLKMILFLVCASKI